MTDIGGNITAQIQVKKEVGTNRMGEKVVDWETIYSPTGFLDLLNGDSKYTNFNAKIQESTHIFICDYFPISVTSNESRVVIEGQIYDIKLIDDPMRLHEHLELFLSFVG